MTNEFNYARYLQTDHWLELRAAKLEDSGHRCERCRRRTGLEVHHRHYNTVGRERLSDLEVLCRRCHQEHHDLEVAFKAMHIKPKPERKCPKEQERDFKAWKHARMKDLDSRFMRLAKAGRNTEAEAVYQELMFMKSQKFGKSLLWKRMCR